MAKDTVKIDREKYRLLVAARYLNAADKRISTKPLLGPVPVTQSLAYIETRLPVSCLLATGSDGALLITD
jgi:hypothetical protein